MWEYQFQCFGLPGGLLSHPERVPADRRQRSQRSAVDVRASGDFGGYEKELGKSFGKETEVTSLRSRLTDYIFAAKTYRILAHSRGKGTSAFNKKTKYEITLHFDDPGLVDSTLDLISKAF